MGHDMISEEAALGLAVLIGLWLLGGIILGIVGLVDARRGRGISLSVMAIAMGVPGLLLVLFLGVLLVGASWGEAPVAIGNDPSKAISRLLISLGVLAVLLGPVAMGTIGTVMSARRDKAQRKDSEV